MIVAPRTESISIDDGSPRRELSKEDVVRTVLIVPIVFHEIGGDSSTLRILGGRLLSYVPGHATGDAKRRARVRIEAQSVPWYAGQRKHPGDRHGHTGEERFE